LLRVLARSATAASGGRTRRSINAASACEAGDIPTRAVETRSACSFYVMSTNGNKQVEGRVSSVGKPYHNTTELAGFMKVNDTSAAGR
jgi:hypothetical protein